VRLCRNGARPPPLLVLLAAVALGKFFGHELILGQVNILFGVLAAMAFLAMKGRNELLAGVLIGLTIAIKPYGVLFLPWLAARRKVASVVGAVVTAGVIAL